MKWEYSIIIMAYDKTDKNGDLHDGNTGRYKSKSADALSKELAIPSKKEPPIIVDTQHLIEDEVLPRSVGAKWANFEIRMPDGSKAKFIEGAKLEKKEIIAGYGARRKIDDINDLVNTFPETKSTPRFWAKVKGETTIILSMGGHLKAELHWYEHPKIGKYDFKYKRRVQDES